MSPLQLCLFIFLYLLIAAGETDRFSFASRSKYYPDHAVRIFHTRVNWGGCKWLQCNGHVLSLLSLQYWGWSHWVLIWLRWVQAVYDSPGQLGLWLISATRYSLFPLWRCVHYWTCEQGQEEVLTADPGDNKTNFAEYYNTINSSVLPRYHHIFLYIHN